MVYTFSYLRISVNRKKDPLHLQPNIKDVVTAVKTALNDGLTLFRHDVFLFVR